MARLEFFRAAYWSFQSRDVRLTEYEERNLPRMELHMIAVTRAREQGLTPIYERIAIGEFLRG